MAGEVGVFNLVPTITGKQMRTVCRENMGSYGRQQFTAPLLNFIFNFPYTIGSGNVCGLVASLSNFYFELTGAIGAGGGGEKDTGNSVFVDEMALWSGSTAAPAFFTAPTRTRTLTSGAVDLQTDLIMPAALGLTVLTRSTTTVWAKGRGHVTTNGHYIPIARSRTAVAGTQCSMYDPAATTPSSTDVAGVYTFTGTTPTNMTLGFTPLILGYFA